MPVFCFLSVQDGNPFFPFGFLRFLRWFVGDPVSLSRCVPESVFLAVLHIYKGANVSFVHFFSARLCELLFLWQSFRLGHKSRLDLAPRMCPDMSFVYLPSTRHPFVLMCQIYSSLPSSTTLTLLPTPIFLGLFLGFSLIALFVLARG